jgi:Na+/H+ antiporter NhaD/arsenite permease-like protein
VFRSRRRAIALAARPFRGAALPARAFGCRMMKNAALKPLLCAIPLLAFSAGTAWAADPAAPGFVPPVWTVLPFIGMLLSIALFPLAAPHFWEHHYPKVSVFWLVVGIGAMVLSVPAGMTVGHAFGARFFSTTEEYVAFIVLLASLFIISGGIHISGHLPGTPAVNTAILFAGGVLASAIGTTGASMVLIRPLIRANEGRKYQVHLVVFFIFIVSNIGGVLTPIGDPPLFLGFLQGIPFEWTLKLAPLWAVCILPLLAVFYAWDAVLAKREGWHHSHAGLHFRVAGKRNIVLMLGVVAAVILSGVLHFETSISVFGLGELHVESLMRDGSQIALAGLSLWLTAHSIRRGNNFTYGPIREVAILFLGIFATMIPALMLLNARGAELGLDSPAKYFWASGLLSSFLDNAPTYLTFLATGMGSLNLHNAADLLHSHQGVLILEAVSAGSVFMGANTYIGNGPNFMVKAIAEQHGVKMPSFFGYMLYSCGLLLPLFLAVTLIFF